VLGLAVLAASLPGCGFRPIYASAGAGKAGPAATGLAQTEVGLIPERQGQLMRLALQRRLDGTGAAVARRYDLAVTVRIDGDSTAIQQDSSATRLRFVATANWVLTAQDPPRGTLATGTAKVVDGMNLFDEQIFAADLETEAVQRRIVEALADQITMRLAAYFNRRAGAA
jgi:LPS-assembly lipoprotein